MTDEQRIGPTGEFPDGKKVAPDDRGSLNMRVGVDEFNNQIVVEFGVQVKWIALGVDDAVGLAQLILDKAEFLNNLNKRRMAGVGWAEAL
jgi:hypothetical protein